MPDDTLFVLELEDDNGAMQPISVCTIKGVSLLARKQSAMQSNRKYKDKKRVELRPMSRKEWEDEIADKMMANIK